jgi:hypothetical protein
MCRKSKVPLRRRTVMWGDQESFSYPANYWSNTEWLTTWVWSLCDKTASRLCLTRSWFNLAGCPSRKTRILLLANLSRRLSTATFDGAQHRTLWPWATSCEIFKRNWSSCHPIYQPHYMKLLLPYDFMSSSKRFWCEISILKVTYARNGNE